MCGWDTTWRTDWNKIHCSPSECRDWRAVHGDGKSPSTACPETLSTACMCINMYKEFFIQVDNLISELKDCEQCLW